MLMFDENYFQHLQSTAEYTKAPKGKVAICNKQMDLVMTSLKECYVCRRTDEDFKVLLKENGLMIETMDTFLEKLREEYSKLNAEEKKLQSQFDRKFQNYKKRIDKEYEFIEDLRDDDKNLLDLIVKLR